MFAEIVGTGDDENRGKWQKKAQLSDSKKSVNDVKFSPRHLGLKLATASADGILRIYEASDVFSLNYWPLQVLFYNLSFSSLSLTLFQGFL